MNTTLIINPELKDLLPPLDSDEYAGLEESILNDGCTDKLIAWGDILVDGHHRYTICTKHGIPYKVKQRDFKNIEEVKLWMWKHQESRRNLTFFQRAEIALKMKDVLSAQAKDRQRGGRGGVLLLQNSGEANNTTERELAKRSGISHDTIRKVEFLLEHADEETKAKLRSTKKETSIHKEFTRLKAELDAQKPKTEKKARSKSTTASEQNQTETDSKKTRSASSEKKSNTAKSEAKTTKPDTEPTTTSEPKSTTLDGSPETVAVSLKNSPKVNERYSCGVQFEPDPDDDFFDWITDEERKELFEMRKTCPNRLVPQIHNFTIQNIPEHSPEPLLSCLYFLFKTKYREKLAYGLLRRIFAEDDPELARTIVSNLQNEFQNQ